MVCNVCGQVLTPDSLFCENCGSPVSAAPVADYTSDEGQRICTACNTLWDASVMFCAECGSPTSEYHEEAYAETTCTEASDYGAAEQRICTNCNTLWGDEVAFCAECGSPTVPYSGGAVPAAVTDSPGASVCPNCGSYLEPGSVFCGSCGMNLAGSAPSVPVDTFRGARTPADPVGQSFMHKPQDDDLG